MEKGKRVVGFAVSMVLVLNNLDLSFAAKPKRVDPPKASAPAAPAAPAKQPLIEVSVDSLEISNTKSKQVGFLWGQQLAPAQTGQQGAIVNNLNFIEQNVPSILKVGTVTRTALANQLDILIQDNQARILANPTLLTKSGYEANFLVGGEIPYPSVGQGGVSGVEFKKYGVMLKILPELTPDQRINAVINVGVTNPDPSVSITINGTTVPGLSSREAGTKVEISDGETVVLAGIKQSRKSKVVTKVPILGYIPLLGMLFTHTQDQDIQTSLVLFVTFHLIK
jgi:pilus assembly protein CpaC